MSEEKLDLHSELSAIYDKHQSAAEGVPSTDAPPSVEATDQAASPDPVVETPATEAPADGRVRGPDGKFIKADEAAKPNNNKIAADAKIGEPAKEPVSDQSVTTGIQTPVSWSAAAKAEFSKLPLAVQEAVAKREMEVSQGFKQYGEKVKTYEAIDKVLEPLRPALQQAGLTADQYIGRLRAAEQTLESNPVEGIKWLAKSYGVDLAQLATGQPETPVDPTIAALQQKITQLESGWNQQQQASQMAVQQETQTAIEKFAADPKNEFFDQVRDDMSVLIRTGKATSLPDAYNKAVRMNDEVYQILQARQADAIQRKFAEENRKQAAGARKAAGTNVSGNAGTSPAQIPTIRDSMSQVYDRMTQG